MCQQICIKSLIKNFTTFHLVGAKLFHVGWHDESNGNFLKITLKTYLKLNKVEVTANNLLITPSYLKHCHVIPAITNINNDGDTCMIYSMSSLKQNLLKEFTNLFTECKWRICITQRVFLTVGLLNVKQTSLLHSNWWHCLFCSAQSCI